ncbi:MAG: citramalate synthase, partial [Clostridia bacterium]|nr:citramalate synthase [Clostridia bacterium]
MSRTVQIFDTTLRDGAQAEGVSYSLQDKRLIVRELDAFGADYIEAGNPASNPKDYQFFEEMKGVPLSHARLCAFGSTAHPGRPVDQDENLQKLLGADTPAVAIVGKASPLHVAKILGISEDENLRIVRQSVALLKAAGREVIFDAEHFFDGYKEDPAFALAVLRAATDGGADVLCLCDTNGGTLPPYIAEVTRAVTEAFPDTRVAIHCHDDIGCAVAGSLAAVEAGASMVQGTFLGYGERCGNAALSTLLPTLVYKCGFECSAKLDILKPLARKIAEISNLRMRHSMPYVGKCAFA